jgi:hypothetical protein
MASEQISETTRPAYLWSGSEWIPIGDGGGGGGNGNGSNGRSDVVIIRYLT